MLTFTFQTDQHFTYQLINIFVPHKMRSIAKWEGRADLRQRSAEEGYGQKKAAVRLMERRWYGGQGEFSESVPHYLRIAPRMLARIKRWPGRAIELPKHDFKHGT